MALLASFLTFLTSIWGEGVVFTWLLNLSGISALLVLGSIGFVSLRFRRAWRAQGRSVDDLPYVQPLYPVLPVTILVIAVLLFIGQGYSAVKEQPFSAIVRVSRCFRVFVRYPCSALMWPVCFSQNIVASYIGVALYIVLYAGYTLYDRFVVRSPLHFVPLMEVDLDTDAVWRPGEGQLIRAREREEIRRKEEMEGSAHGLRHWVRRVRARMDYI